MPPIYINGQEVVKRYVGIQEVVAAYVGSQQVFSSGVSLTQIQDLFASGEKGAIWDYSDKANAYQDSVGTTPVTAPGQPIGRVNDLSGLGNHLTQSTSGLRPMFVRGAAFDGVDDGFVTQAMNWGASTKITSVMSLRQGYQTYAYAIVDVYTTALGTNTYVGKRVADSKLECAFKAPVSLSEAIDNINHHVLAYSYDTVPVQQADAIKVSVDGTQHVMTNFVANRNYGETLSPVTMRVGTDYSGNYPYIGERYRQVVINRDLTTEEMALVRQWCEEGRPTYATGLTADLNMFQISGQSLAEGGVGAPVTTVQEYDNVMFTVRESNPTAYVPAVNVTTNLETPMYGQIGYLKALIAGQSGADNYQMLGCNNGQGSASILVLGKGEPTFVAAMSQVAAAKTIATGLGKTFKFRAVSWVQGEADNAMSRVDYKNTLFKLASNYNHMGKAAAGQEEDVILITSQVISNALPNVALAQLDAALEHPLIYMSTPLYHFDFDVDGRHLVALSSKQLGGYMAIVYKTVLVDGKDWSPVRPLSYVKSGSDVTITMHVPVGPLALDTTLLPAQTNYGFAAFDAGGTPISITGVTLVDTDKVKITTASAIPSGGYVTYAQSAQPDPIRSQGGCGNLRDSQGASMTYLGKPMHNWCVLFTQVIA